MSFFMTIKIESGVCFYPRSNLFQRGHLRYFMWGNRENVITRKMPKEILRPFGGIWYGDTARVLRGRVCVLELNVPRGTEGGKVNDGTNSGKPPLALAECLQSAISGKGVGVTRNPGNPSIPFPLPFRSVSGRIVSLHIWFTIFCFDVVK